MFDCNRAYWHNEIIEEEKTYPKNSRYIYMYSALPGKTTKALNASSSYIEHLERQTK